MTSVTPLDTAVFEFVALGTLAGSILAFTLGLAATVFWKGPPALRFRVMRSSWAKLFVVPAVYLPLFWLICAAYGLQLGVLMLLGPWPQIPDWYLHALLSPTGVQSADVFVYWAYNMSLELLLEGSVIVLLQLTPTSPRLRLAPLLYAFVASGLVATITTAGFASGNPSLMLTCDLVEKSVLLLFYVVIALHPWVPPLRAAVRLNTLLPVLLYGGFLQLSSLVIWALPFALVIPALPATLVIYRSVLMPVFLYLTLLLEGAHWRRILLRAVEVTQALPDITASSAPFRGAITSVATEDLATAGDDDGSEDLEDLPPIPHYDKVMILEALTELHEHTPLEQTTKAGGAIALTSACCCYCGPTAADARTRADFAELLLTRVHEAAADSGGGGGGGKADSASLPYVPIETLEVRQQLTADAASGVHAAGGGARTQLGRGGQAQVFVGRMMSNELVAIKLFSVAVVPAGEAGAAVSAVAGAATRAGAVGGFEREVMAYTRLRSHPHAAWLRCHGFTVVEPTLGLILEIAERGSLLHVLFAISQLPRVYGRAFRPLQPTYAMGKHAFVLPWRHKYSLALDGARALAHLHSLGLVHADVKVHNFMVTRGWRLKLGDPGSVCTFDEAAASDAPRFGTPLFMPPEAPAVFGPAADVYGFAFVLWSLFAERIAFFEETTGMPPRAFDAFVGSVRASASPRRPVLHRGLPASVARIIEAAWGPNPAARPTAAALVQLLRRAAAGPDLPPEDAATVPATPHGAGAAAAAAFAVLRRADSAPIRIGR